MPAARGQSIRLAMPARTEASYACQKEHSCCWFRGVRKSSIGTHRSAARRGARIDLPCERSDLGLYRRQTAKRAQKEASLSPRVLPKTAVQFENNALSVDAAVIGQGRQHTRRQANGSLRTGHRSRCRAISAVVLSRKPTLSPRRRRERKRDPTFNRSFWQQQNFCASAI